MSKHSDKFEFAIKLCRLCETSIGDVGMSLGSLAFTGIFPLVDEISPYGVLELFHCTNCNLIQTNRDFDRKVMYGDNYGYRSGLNKSMALHLTNKIRDLISNYQIQNNSTIVDIGSNDGTLLNAVPDNFTRIGVDPTIKKFSAFYDPKITQVPEFFDETTLAETANLITTISMFYDLPDVKKFVSNLLTVLDMKTGIWHMEQAYWPQTVRTLGYDTICHEHLEYYSLSTIMWIAKEFNLKIVNFGFNEVNGGSFYVDLSHANSVYKQVNSELLNWAIKEEKSYLSRSTLVSFEDKMLEHANSLNSLISIIKGNNETIVALGASTKGNVLLQIAKLSNTLVDSIGEINSYKFGKVTPGTGIPIVAEADLLAQGPDYVLILPWHFATGIIEQIRKQSPRSRIIVPLPEIRII